MTRTMTLRDFVLEELSRQLREEYGVEIVDERPTPQLATRDGNVVHLPPRPQPEKGDLSHET
jgi:hypothetical protein